jgi:hypothetical protein
MSDLLIRREQRALTFFMGEEQVLTSALPPLPAIAVAWFSSVDEAVGGGPRSTC